MESIYTYENLNLPDNPTSILGEEFWFGEDVSLSLLAGIKDPIKFSATVSIYVKEGECVADINLIEYHIKAPAIVQIKANQILQPKSATPDFKASYIVLSEKLSESLYVNISSNTKFGQINRYQLIKVPDELVGDFNNFYEGLKGITSDKSNPFLYNALFHYIMTFFYDKGIKIFYHPENQLSSTGGRITDKFLLLLQQHYKKERFLEFYAEQIGITTKHLSRTLKEQTGFTAVEWISRYVILEAKVMLKSSNLNIQQIADELNFKSQSLFGKYFKNCTGYSPKAFRNL